MIDYRVNERIEESNENGIWLEFLEQTWIFIVKDDIWTKEEIAIFRKTPIKISYFQKGVVDGFLLEIKDLMETSDVPFCLVEATRGFLNTLKDLKPYKILILLVDKTNKICAKSEGEMSVGMSNQIKKGLREQKMKDYDSKGFNISLTKLQNRYEPYELQPFVLGYEKIQCTNLK